MSTGRKLAVGVVMVAGATAYMAYLGAAASWQYYVTVDECLAGAGELPADRIRISGKIAPSTLTVAADRNQAEFCLEGSEEDLPVICRGPLPDNLAEGVDVVVEGRLDRSGLLRAHKVLTRCAGKYKSRQPSGRSEGAARSGRKGSS